MYYVADVGTTTDFDIYSLCEKLRQLDNKSLTYNNLVLTKCIIDVLRHNIEEGLRWLHNDDNRIMLKKKLQDLYKRQRPIPRPLNEVLDQLCSITNGLGSVNLLFRFLRTYRRYAEYSQMLSYIFETIPDRVMPHNLINVLLSSIPRRLISNFAQYCTDLVRNMYEKNGALFIDDYSLNEAINYCLSNDLCSDSDKEDCAQLLAIDLSSKISSPVKYVTRDKKLRQILHEYKNRLLSKLGKHTKIVDILIIR